jgi:hypothetical protein
MSQLLLLNPRRRRRRKMTAKQAKYFGGNPRRRRRRKAGGRKGRGGGAFHPKAAITVRANPRRRRHRRHARRSFRRNPALRMPSARGVMNQVMDAGQGAIGATAIDVLMGFIAPKLPPALLGPNVYPVVKGGVAILFGVVGQSFGGGAGRFAAKAAEGSLICTLRDVVRGFLPADLTLGYINSGYVPRQSLR